MTQLEQVIALALDLPPNEQAKLIEQVASHLASHVTPITPQNEFREEHWGKKVIAFLETIDASEWSDIEDPVEWLKAQRRESERQLDWGDKR
jgi:hypothetical protein